MFTGVEEAIMWVNRLLLSSLVVGKLRHVCRKDADIVMFLDLS
jgi:hypothetical protein